MQQPQRVAVVGNSGSGKSSLSKEIAARLDCDHIELDSIHHLPGWIPIDRDKMRQIISERTESDCWVVDGNYRSFTQDIVFPKADTVIWLDVPRRVVMSRVIRRTLGRIVTRTELWNGNRERFGNLFKTAPEENIILWSWTQHEKYRQQYLDAKDDATNAHLNWVHLTTRNEARDWLATLG